MAKTIVVKTKNLRIDNMYTESYRDTVSFYGQRYCQCHSLRKAAIEEQKLKNERTCRTRLKYLLTSKTSTALEKTSQRYDHV